MYKNLFKIYNKRFSCRIFDDEFIIPKSDIDKIVSSAYLWPSSYALWPFELIIINNKNIIKLLWKTLKEHNFIMNSSLLIFFCQRNELFNNINIKENWNTFMTNDSNLIKANEWHLDSAISGTYIDLTATSLWYNTIWMWYYQNKIWRRILKIPDNLTLLFYIAIWKNKFPNKHKKIDLSSKKDIKNKIHYLNYWKKYYDK